MTRDDPVFRDRFRRNLWQQMQQRGIPNPYRLHRMMLKSGLDIAQNNTYRYCAGEQEPSLGVAVGIAKALGCTVDDLVKEEEGYEK